MFRRVILIPLTFAFLCTQSGISLDAKEVVDVADSEPQDLIVKHISKYQRNSSSENGTRLDRQIADEDNIDTDGPYGYVPRVVHGVRKIVKGLLNGSVHEIMHGAFGIAPEDVADDLVGTYNRVFGIPDPEDLDLDETTEKTKPPPVKTKVNGSTKGVADGNTTPSTFKKKPLKYHIVKNKNQQKQVQTINKNTNPVDEEDTVEDDN